MKSLLIALLVCSGLLVGCGIAKDAEDTLKEVKKTNDQMQTTNDKITQTNTAIEKTNRAVHLQTLSVAKEHLLSEENTQNPLVPTGLTPDAKIFAMEATTEELIQTFHTLLTDAMKGDNKVLEYIGLRPHARLVRFMAASAIAALTPKDKYNKLYEEQITNEGKYYDTMKAFILCRYSFTRQYLLEPVFDATLIATTKDKEGKSIPAPRTPNLELLRDAVEQLNTLKGIAALPFARDLSVTVPQVITIYIRDEKEPEKIVKTIYNDLGPVAIDTGDLEKQPKRLLDKFAGVKYSDRNAAEAESLLNQLR